MDCSQAVRQWILTPSFVGSNPTNPATTRESPEVRKKSLQVGISQISGASKTSVGGYANPEPEEENSAQFDISDNRTLDEVIKWLLEMDFIPSFCTACYRAGRTGDRFMELCKSKQIQNCCHPNALITLKEYLEDYASPETKALGNLKITKEIPNIPNENTKRQLIEILDKVKKGERDFRF